ncbi:hypothetical protein [Hoylesella nanceiensis]
MKNKLTAFALQYQCNCTLKALILQRKNNAFESGVEKKWLAKAYQTFEKGEKIVASTHLYSLAEKKQTPFEHKFFKIIK